MAEVSKTAKQAMQAGQNVQRETKVTPPEEMIRVLILNTKQGIFTGNIDYTRALINAYEAQVAEIEELKTANTVINAANETNSKLIETQKLQLQATANAAIKMAELETENASLKSQLAAAIAAAEGLPSTSTTVEPDSSEPGLDPASQGQDSIGGGQQEHDVIMREITHS
jgi:hypothetical protein